MGGAGGALRVDNKGLCELGKVDLAVLVGVHGLDHGLDGLVANGLVLVEKDDLAGVGELDQVDGARVVLVDEVEESGERLLVASERVVDVLVLGAERVEDVAVVEAAVVLDQAAVHRIALHQLVLVLEPRYALHAHRARPVAQRRRPLVDAEQAGALRVAFAEELVAYYAPVGVEQSLQAANGFRLEELDRLLVLVAAAAAARLRRRSGRSRWCHELLDLELASRSYDANGRFVDAAAVVGGREDGDALVAVVELVALVFALV